MARQKKYPMTKIHPEILEKLSPPRWEVIIKYIERTLEESFAHQQYENYLWAKRLLYSVHFYIKKEWNSKYKIFSVEKENYQQYKAIAEINYSLWKLVSKLFDGGYITGNFPVLKNQDLRVDFWLNLNRELILINGSMPTTSNIEKSEITKINRKYLFEDFTKQLKKGINPITNIKEYPHSYIFIDCCLNLRDMDIFAKLFDDYLHLRTKFISIKGGDVFYSFPDGTFIRKGKNLVNLEDFNPFFFKKNKV